MAPDVCVELVYAASSQDRWCENLTLPFGSMIKDAIGNSSLYQKFPELAQKSYRVGIFSRLVDDAYVLCQGDRIEIYRSLICDPKARRHQKIVKRRIHR